jgi:hypothetical protein
MAGFKDEVFFGYFIESVVLGSLLTLVKGFLLFKGATARGVIPTFFTTEELFETTEVSINFEFDGGSSQCHKDVHSL